MRVGSDPNIVDVTQGDAIDSIETVLKDSVNSSADDLCKYTRHIGTYRNPNRLTVLSVSYCSIELPTQR